MSRSIEFTPRTERICHANAASVQGVTTRFQSNATRSNRVGDYSYRIHIYGLPVQGLMVHLLGPQGMWENVLYSTPPTLVLWILSWHLVEQPTMAAKPGLMTWLVPGPRQA